jgi:hypothetical protein
MLHRKNKQALTAVLLFILNCSSVHHVNRDATDTVSTTGIFEGKIVTEGNFRREQVYKINSYCITLKDITPSRADLLRGKKVKVTGKLRIAKGVLFPPKSSTDGTIYEPYKEPDKKFIDNPVFIIIDE